MPSIDFIVKLDSEGRTELKIEGFGSVTGRFEFDLSERVEQVLQEIEAGYCKSEDLKDVGSQLFSGLFAQELGKLFQKVYIERQDQPVRLRLAIANTWWRLPWEALYDERRSAFFSSNPKHSIIRDTLPEDWKQPDIAPRPFPLKVLAVIPHGSGLDVEAEWDKVKLALADSIKRAEVELGRLDDVTPDRLQEQLKSGVDILHYVGHGRTGAAGFEIRLNHPNPRNVDFWMDAATFASLFWEAKPRLVVLNCCRGAEGDPLPRGLSGIGAHLMKVGIPATVAMRYEVADSMGRRFAADFYRELFKGEPGKIDAAVSRARYALFINKSDDTYREFITPVLYMAPGTEFLYAPPVQRPEPPRPPPPEPQTTLPASFVDAIKSGECMPIFGAGILKLGAVRAGNPIPQPGDLIRSRAEAIGYPHALVPGTDPVGGTFSASLCQYLQSKRQRGMLIRALQTAYQSVQPTDELMVLASMAIPAFLYLDFDPMLEKALKQRRKTIQAIAGMDKSIEVTSPDTPLLVYLRGYLQDPDSLVFSEEEHAVLWDQIGAMSRTMRDFLKGGVGRAALIAGVSPKDWLLKRLASKALNAGDKRSQGPTFFVCKDHTPADDAFWEKYDICWIELELDDFVNNLRGILA
jgi:hypothetical protein